MKEAIQEYGMFILAFLIGCGIVGIIYMLITYCGNSGAEFYRDMTNTACILLGGA